MHKAAPTQSTVSRDGTRSKIVPPDVPPELSGVGQTVTVVVKVTADVAGSTVIWPFERDVEGKLEDVFGCGGVVAGE